MSEKYQVVLVDENGFRYYEVQYIHSIIVSKLPDKITAEKVAQAFNAETAPLLERIAELEATMMDISQLFQEVDLYHAPDMRDALETILDKVNNALKKAGDNG